MMTIDRFIRLPFTEWSVWALPIIAHEYWRVSARRQFTNYLAAPLGPDGAKLIEENIIRGVLAMLRHICHGSGICICGNHVVVRSEARLDDLRVSAIIAMLRCMNERAR